MLRRELIVGLFEHLLQIIRHITALKIDRAVSAASLVIFTSRIGEHPADYFSIVIGGTFLSQFSGTGL